MESAGFGNLSSGIKELLSVFDTCCVNLLDMLRICDCDIASFHIILPTIEYVQLDRCKDK